MTDKLEHGFYFAREKETGEVVTVYASTTQGKIITDKESEKKDLELLCPIPEKVVSSVLKNRTRLLNMTRLLGRMR